MFTRLPLYIYGIVIPLQKLNLPLNFTTDVYYYCYMLIIIHKIIIYGINNICINIYINLTTQNEKYIGNYLNQKIKVKINKFFIKTLDNIG